MMVKMKMAKKKKTNIKNKNKFKGKSNFKLKKKTKRSIREVKHLDQYKNARIRQAKKEDVTKEEPDEVPEPMHVDSLEQLLSTFPTHQQKHLGTAVDSDSEESEHDDNEDNEVASFSPGKGIELPYCTDSENEELSGEDHVSDKEEVDSDDLNVKDPFSSHLEGLLHPITLTSLQSTPRQETVHELEWPVLGKMKVSIPIQGKSSSQTKSLLDDNDFVGIAEPPKLISKISWKQLAVKSQISVNVREANEHQLEGISKHDLTPLQTELFSVINNYQDLFYPRSTFENGEQLRFVYCLHAVNHILKTRLKIIHHNERITRKNKTEVPDEFRDQGLARPKVLILVPFRNSAYRVIQMISRLIFGKKKANVVNKSRFKEEYTGSELFMPKKNPKPEDYELMFSGNIDDSFKIGVSLTKSSLKLYSDFYSSDLIVASPLGIRMLIGADGEKDRDYDFLSSIELLILDQAEVFLMQNWDHVLHVMNHMHLQPKENHDVDFSRVRVWALNGWTRFYRQTLLFSSILTPELNSLFGRHCSNFAGSVRLPPAVEKGSISQVVIPLPHFFRRFKASELMEAANDRFKYFCDEVLPQFHDLTGVLLYVPSYFDFVRIRNYLRDKDYSYVPICEYSKEGKVAKARDMFFHYEVRFLLYSERFHFYRRINVKGIRHLVFYQPPTFPHFYSELCNMMQESNQNRTVEDGNQSVTVIYCQYDVHSLAGVIRAPRANRIITSNQTVFMFTTGKT